MEEIDEIYVIYDGKFEIAWFRDLKDATLFIRALFERSQSLPPETICV